MRSHRCLLRRAGVAMTGVALLAVHAVPAMQVAAPTISMPDSTGEYSDVQLVVSVQDRTLWVVAGRDTVRTIAVAVPSGEVLNYAGRRWQFNPPEGKRVVIAKKIDPLWAPPDWHYAEVAREYGLHVKVMPSAGVTLSDGRRLVLRDSLVGIVEAHDTQFALLPVDEHIIFDSTLFIPPMASHNRQIAGELGKYALDLGNGYLLHGTRDASSIGTASTHGCIRLSDEDVAWLYAHVPVGTPVYVR